MSANKATNTKPERLLRFELRAIGLPGYRLHWKVSGRPDIAFPGRSLAIFVHGCYWHRCPKCDLPLPRNNRDFWREKFRRNKERDRRKVEALEEEGWKVLTFWECDIKENASECARIVKRVIENGEAESS